MLRERQIDLEWLERAVAKPALVEQALDGTVHYLRQIPEFGSRWLRVVVAGDGELQRVVTVFFDRRVK